MKRIDEADDFFAAPGNDQQAADFYNRLATLATQENFEPLRDEFMDRALLGLAGKLRQSAGHTDRAVSVSRLFGSAGPWEPSVVRDADVAVRGIPRSAPVRSEARRIKTHSGRVTAACTARDSGDLFLGFADGVVVHFDPRTGNAMTWPPEPGGSVVSLATDSQARALVVVARAESQALDPAYRALSFLRKGSAYYFRTSRVFESQSVPCLASIGESNGELMVLIVGDLLVQFRSLPELFNVARMDQPSDSVAGLLLDSWEMSHIADSALLLGRSTVAFRAHGSPPAAPSSGSRAMQRSLNLLAFAPSRLFEDGPPMFSWLAPQRTYLEMVFVDEEGSLHWLVLRVLTDDPAVLFDQRASSVFRCAALLKPGKAAAVHRDRVVWLARTDRNVTARTQTPLGLSDAVACFASPVTNELLVVAAEGDVIRVSVPG